MTIQMHAIECLDAHEALKIARESECGAAILLGDRHYAIYRPEAERLEVAGVKFAYLHEVVRADGSPVITTVPIND